MDCGSWLLAGCLLALLIVGGGAAVTLTNQTATDSTATLVVRPADGTASANETVAVGALTPAQRDLFERARNTTEPIDIPSDVSRDPFVEYWYVRGDNWTYEVAVAVS